MKPAVIVTSALAAIAVCAVPVAAQAYEGRALQHQYDDSLVAAQHSQEELARATGYAASVSYSADALPASMAIMTSSLKSQLAKVNVIKNTTNETTRTSSAGNEALARAVAILDRTSRDQTDTAKAITQIVNDMRQYHGLKQISDASKALDSALSAAQAAIDAPNWRTDDAQVKNALDALSKTVDAAGAVDRHDPSAMQQAATDLTNGMRTLTDAIAAYDAAASAAAASSTATEQIQIERRDTATTRHATASSSNQGTDGYTLAGDCYTAAECQAQIDVAGRDQLHALHTPKGSTYYEIHNDHGGSSTWGKSSVTINGVTRNLGQWRPARYNAAGQPLEESEKGTYFQTCDANGKVRFAPIQQ